MRTENSAAVIFTRSTKTKPVGMGPYCVYVIVLEHSPEFTFCLAEEECFHFIIIYGLMVIAMCSSWHVSLQISEELPFTLTSSTLIWGKSIEHTFSVVERWLQTSARSICLHLSELVLPHSLDVRIFTANCVLSLAFLLPNQYVFIRFDRSRSQPLFTRKWTSRRSCPVTNPNVPHFSIHWQRKKIKWENAFSLRRLGKHINFYYFCTLFRIPGREMPINVSTLQVA